MSTPAEICGKVRSAEDKNVHRPCGIGINNGIIQIDFEKEGKCMSTQRLPEIYGYLDYQEYLREVYNAEKKQDELFSYRVLSAACDMDASLLVKILQGKRHLSRDGVDKLSKVLRLDVKRADYFRELVAFAKASKDVDVRKHFETLQRMRPAECRLIEDDKYRYFQHWYFPAIRSALEVFPYRGNQDATALGKRFQPMLAAQQVSEAMDVLLRLGLIVLSNEGRYLPAAAHLTTGERWQSAAVREFQRQVIRLAEESVEGVPKHLRDVSTLTLSLDANQIERIRAVLAEARRSVVRQVDAMPPDSCNAVYQLNMQLFPVLSMEEGV
jgi:uncharacterized protein (TIGR02147 family)